jgi:hypothetical protein
MRVKIPLKSILRVYLKYLFGVIHIQLNNIKTLNYYAVLSANIKRFTKILCSLKKGQIDSPETSVNTPAYNSQQSRRATILAVLR